jgi:hypothetical protein
MEAHAEIKPQTMEIDARGSNRFMINLLSIELLLHRNVEFSG